MSHGVLGLNESFFTTKIFMILAAAAAVLAAAALIFLAYRFIAGSRLRLPRNGRARPPRLGIVDAFDLDRHRQLIIVRRDNVEHLLMIGGPNDLVIESEIIRAENRELRSGREAKLRDKELRERDAREFPQVPAAAPWPAPAQEYAQIPPQRGVPAYPAAGQVKEAAFMNSLEESTGAAASAASLPHARTSISSMAARHTLGSLPSQKTTVQQAPVLSSLEAGQKREAVPVLPARSSRAAAAVPVLQPRARRKVLGTASQAALSQGRGSDSSTGLEETLLAGDVESSAPGPLPSVPEPGQSIARSSGARAAEASPAGQIDLLEEEMARLLGRGPVS